MAVTTNYKVIENWEWRIEAVTTYSFSWKLRMEAVTIYYAIIENWEWRIENALNSTSRSLLLCVLCVLINWEWRIESLTTYYSIIENWEWRIENALNSTSRSLLLSVLCVLNNWEWSSAPQFSIFNFQLNEDFLYLIAFFAPLCSLRCRRRPVRFLNIKNIKSSCSSKSKH